MDKKSRNIKRRPGKRRKKRIRFKPRFFVFLAVLIIVLALLLSKLFGKKTVDYRDKYDKRYQSAGKYETNLRHANSNFFYDYYLEVDGRYKRLDEPYINDKTSLTFKKALYLPIIDYINEEDIKGSSLTIMVKNLKSGSSFFFYPKKTRDFKKLNDLSLVMSVKKLEENGKLKRNSLEILSEGDYSPGGYFFSKKDIGKKQRVSELLVLAYRHGDTTASNMLYSLVNRITKKAPRVYLADQLGLKNISEEMNGWTALSLAEELHRNKDLYLPVLRDTKDQEDQLFQKNIYTDEENINFSYKGDKIIYDLGDVDGPVPYVYVIYGEGLDEKVISDLGDIINRTVNDYNIRKKIYN